MTSQRQQQVMVAPPTEVAADEFYEEDVVDIDSTDQEQYSYGSGNHRPEIK